MKLLRYWGLSLPFNFLFSVCSHCFSLICFLFITTCGLLEHFWLIYSLYLFIELLLATLSYYLDIYRYYICTYMHNLSECTGIPVLSVWNLQFSSVTQSCLTLCDPMNCSTPVLPVHHKLLEFTLTHVHWVGDAIQHPLLLLPLIPPSIRVFFNESPLHMRWPKYWSFSFNISPSNEHPGLISFRMDWLDLLAVQGTLKSLLQYHSSKASILWRSAFFPMSLTLLYLYVIGSACWVPRWGMLRCFWAAW